MIKEEAEMLKRKVSGIEAELPNIEEELKILLIPKDPNDDKDVIVRNKSSSWW